jgi:hypothetical protein
MTTAFSDTAKPKIIAGSQDRLSKQAARAVMFVLLLAVLMALSAMFLILNYESSETAVAQRGYAAEGAEPSCA